MKFITAISILVITLFASCETYSSLQKVTHENKNSFEIKKMNGCCGCVALYCNFYNNTKVAEQFVVETGCNLYEPTKHVFEYKKNKIVGVRSMVATFDSSFSVPVSLLEKQVFLNMDKIYTSSNLRSSRQIIFGKITGFKTGKQLHFPVELKMSKKLKYNL